MSHLKLPPYQRQRKSCAGATIASTAAPVSCFQTSFQLLVTAPVGGTSSGTMAQLITNQKLPNGYVALEHQVAGHTFQVGTDEIGMLKNVDDGSVMKPAGSPMCAAREIKFYEQLLTTTDPVMMSMRDFTSEYRGTQTLTVGNKTIKFIKLRDLTHGMLEPCVIDLKMGKRTWDPLASDQKREAEEVRFNLLLNLYF